MNDQLANARRLLESGEFDSAESIYREILQHSPQHSDALYGLGLVCFSKKDLAAAEHWFRESLKTNPRDQKTLFYLGEIATARGDKNSAVMLFARILTLNPEHTGAMDRLSRFASPKSSGPTTRTAPDTAPHVSQSAQPPRPRSSQDSIFGIARHIQLRVVPYRGRAAARQLLTFRVDAIDENGNDIGKVGIELQDFDIRGNVEDGDWVEITEQPEEGGRIKSFMNLSTGTEVNATGIKGWGWSRPE